MYTATSKPPTTAWARHLDAIRRERKWSATQVFEAVYGPLGMSPKSRTAFLPYLADKEPDEHMAAVLTGLFGTPPPDLTPPAVEPQPDLATALMALAVELTAAREERNRYLALESTVKALEETVAGLLRSNRKAGGSGASRAGRVPRTKTE